VPGLSDQLSSFHSSQTVDLGKGLCALIDEALPDFTHLTVLMYLTRNAKGPVTVGEVADQTGDPKKAIQAVLDRFEKQGIVRCSVGFLSRKYAVDRESLKMELIGRLVKLWEHPQSHEAVLRRVLAPKSART
jgi:hypothetical protein